MFVYNNMKKEIIKILSNRLDRKLTEIELQNVMKDRALIALESIIDYVKDDSLSKKELEDYIKQI